MTTPNTNNGQQANWQELYSPTDSHWCDLKRAGLFIIPIMALIFLATIYTFGYVTLQFEAWLPDTFSWYSQYALLLRYFLVILAPILTTIVGLRFLFKQAREFTFSLYQPKADENLSPLIRRKLLGVPPMPPPLNNFFNYPFVLVNSPILDESHWTRWFGGPATLVIYDGVAIYLERGNKFSRVVGPGLPMPFLERHERIKDIIDLRPQIKIGYIQPWTKDGIPIKLKIRAEIQIYSSPEALIKSSKFRYPFDPLAIKAAVECTTVKSTFDGVLHEQSWLDGAWGNITGSVNAFVAGHSLDELFLAPQSENHAHPNHDENLPTEKIEQILSRKISDQVIKEIQTNLQKNGIKVLNMQIIHVEVPKRIGELRTKYWESIRKKISAHRDSYAEAEHIRVREQAHAEAQRTMLMTIIKRLENVPAEQLTESLTLSLSGILDQGLDDPIVRPLIAKEAFAVLDRMRKLLQERF